MFKSIRFSKVMLNEITSGVPFTVYCCNTGKFKYDIFTEKEKMGVFEGVPVEIEFTIDYVNDNNSYDITRIYAIFRANGEKVEMNMVSNHPIMEMNNGMFGPAYMPPERILQGFDGHTVMLFIIDWTIVEIISRSLNGEYRWVYTHGMRYSLSINTNEFGPFTSSPLELSPVKKLCYETIVKSNEKIAVKHLMDAIKAIESNQKYVESNINHIIGPIVEIIHECGKPELFRNIPFEVRKILVPHFNKMEKHEIVSELNHYTDGRYHDLNDMSKWEL